MKNIRKIIAVLVVLCVLVTAQVCTLAEDINAGISSEGAAISQEEGTVVSNLKTAWSAMYKKTAIANFDGYSMFMNQRSTTYTDPSAGSVRKVNFAADGSFEVEKYTRTVNHGLTFNKGENVHFISSITDNSFNNAFNNDSLYFTFNPGTVTAAGNLEVILQYGRNDSTHKFYAEIPFTDEDSENGIKVEIEDLSFNCAQSTDTCSEKHTFDKLSDMLTNPIENVSNPELFAIKIGFSTGTVISNAKISSFEGIKYAELPEGIDSLSTVELYNQAVAAEIDGYENAKGFVEARTALYDYLYDNNQDFIVSELKDSWSKLSKEETVAAFDSNSQIMNQHYTTTYLQAPTVMGITFNNDGTFDKAAYDGSTSFGGNYYYYGMTFNKNVGEENKPFTSAINSTDNNSFNNAFNNDSLYFTFNPGTVTTEGNMRVYLQYNGTGTANVFYSEIPITVDDSKNDKKIILKDLTYKCASESTYSGEWTLTKLSDALKHPENDNDLVAVKIFFNRVFVAEGASISGLKYTNSETVPADTGSEIVTGKALRVDDEYYGEIADTFVERREHLYGIIKGERELGDVNEVEGIDIRDLVRLYSVITADNYDCENEYQVLCDMDVDGYVDGTDISELRTTILNMN